MWSYFLPESVQTTEYPQVLYQSPRKFVSSEYQHCICPSTCNTTSQLSLLLLGHQTLIPAETTQGAKLSSIHSIYDPVSPQTFCSCALHCIGGSPSVQFVFIFMQFLGKIGQNIRLALPPLGWHPSLWKILDPSLHLQKSKLNSVVDFRFPTAKISKNSMYILKICITGLEKCRTRQYF